MVSENLMNFTMMVCGGLFAFGGTGYKLARRLGIPLFLAFIALLSHVLWWKAMLMGLTLFGALTMPYGERTPYWMKFVTFSLYGASFLWIGTTWWMVITPVICISLFALSNWKYTASIFFWKMCEFLMGTFIGITFISSLN